MRHDKEREGDMWSQAQIEYSNNKSWVAPGANSQRSETIWQVQEACVCVCMYTSACASTVEYRGDYISIWPDV